MAKTSIDVDVRPEGGAWRTPHEEAGIEDLVSQLETLKPAIVLLEATGALELPLVAALAAAELPVVVVNPRQVRDFARATGKLAKTDALDAQVLAHFAKAVRPPVRPLRTADSQELNSMTTRRNQIMTMVVAEENRLVRATGSVRLRVRAHIGWLEQELKDLDDALRRMLGLSPVGREQDDLLRSVPGVGEQLSLSLLSYVPELGTLDRKKVAALVGVAPLMRVPEPSIVSLGFHDPWGEPQKGTEALDAWETSSGGPIGYEEIHLEARKGGDEEVWAIAHLL